MAASATPAVHDPFFDPLAPEFRDDPYAAYARLRRADPVHWTDFDGEEGAWVLSRYQDCLSVLKDPRFGMVRSGAEVPPNLAGGAAARVFPHMLIFKDPPYHTRLRRLVSKAFAPRAVESLGPRIQQIVDDLLDGAETRGVMDLMADFAFQVPVFVICDLLGVPREDRVLFKTWTPDFSRIFETRWATPDEIARCHVATAELCKYFEDHIRRRRHDPGDDILSALIEAEVEGDRLCLEELMASAIQLLNAGYETTMGLIGNASLALLRHPDQLRKLRLEPDLLPAAVEEALRYDAPVQYSGRVAHEDVELGGRRIERNQTVFTLLGSANRDPDFCDYPDHFDITRYGVTHLSFGYGAHFCLGAHLARLETRIALGALVSRFPRLALACDADRLERRTSLLFRTLESLPVVFKA